MGNFRHCLDYWRDHIQAKRPAPILGVSLRYGGYGDPRYWLLFWAASYFGFVYRRFLPDSPISLWVGLLLTIAGVAFAVWARVKLGRNWSGIVTVKQNHELIRTGPYALIRHPIYTGLIVAAFGTAIFDGEIRSVILMVAILSVLTHTR